MMSEGLPMEKDFQTVLLLDTYAGLLTEKQRRLCDMYYNQDFSLTEIAEIGMLMTSGKRSGDEAAAAAKTPAGIP